MTNPKHDVVHNLELWLRNEPNAQEIIICRLKDGQIHVSLEYGDRTMIPRVRPHLRGALVGVLERAVELRGKPREPSSNVKGQASQMRNGVLTDRKKPALPGTTPKTLPGLG